MFFFLWTVFVIYLTPVALDALSRWIDRERYEFSAWAWPWVAGLEVYHRLRA